MVCELRFARSFGRSGSPRRGFLAITGCLVIPLMYFMFYNHMDPSIIASRIGGYKQNETNRQNSDNDQEHDHVCSKSDSPSPMAEKHSINNDTNDGRNSTKVANSDERIKTKIDCDFTNGRTDVCEIDGDVRIHGASSSVIYAANINVNESWKIKPYPRKRDGYAMSKVREVMVRPSNDHEESSSCDVKHMVPGVVFSVDGYTSNFFHSFTDVLLPLFITSYLYRGEVQFLVTNMNTKWINAHKLVFDRLSNYQLIDFDNDDRTHCFHHVIVGLRCDRDFKISSSKTSSGVFPSMVDFKKFIANTYSVKRNASIQITDGNGEKPRLLIITRKKTRKLRNVDEIVRTARDLGFKTVVSEAGKGGIAKFAKIVNSCDVMMGVHGAGLTNMIFLPKNGVLIQIIPLGGLDWWAGYYFRDPALEMELKYLDYDIKEEESSLIEIYPRNNTVFTNPLSITQTGWPALKAVYLDKQDVILDVKRFKDVLLQALKLLHL